MKTYYGTKVILAIPMMLGQYNTYRGWDMPEGEDPAAEGYLVEYTDGGKPNHSDHKGYISWSPKSVFKASYQDTQNMSFGHAVAAMKAGERVTRKGWNGKDMFLYYVPAAKYPAKYNETHSMMGVFEDDMVPYQAYIAMKTAQGTVVPWLASQTDILSDDWCFAVPF